MTFYEIRIEIKNIEMNTGWKIQDISWSKDPTHRQIKAIIETAFLNAGFELTEEGVEIFNED